MPLLNEICILSRSPGAELWRDAGRSVRICDQLDEAGASQLLDNVDAKVLLTGASDVDEPSDRELWRSARERGIPSHVVIDHPANLKLRFATADGAVIYPDWVYSSDQILTERLVDAGVPRERIRMLGDAHHDRVRRLAATRTKEDVVALREAWGAAAGTEVVLFASECMREMVAAGRSALYDEFSVLENLVGMVARNERPGGGSIDNQSTLVVVRPHPRDTQDKYTALVSRLNRQSQIIVSNEGTPELALLAADLVVGMNSSLLYEAVALSRPAISLTGHKLLMGKSRAAEGE